MRKELTTQELAKRSEISRRLLKKPPQEWTDSEVIEWVKVGFKLPKAIFDREAKKKLDKEKEAKYKENHDKNDFLRGKKWHRKP